MTDQQTDQQGGSGGQDAKNAQDKHFKALSDLHSAATSAGFRDLANATDRAMKSAQAATTAHASGDTPRQRAATADLLRAHADAITADANKGQMPKDLEKAARKALKTFGNAVMHSSGSDEPI